MSERVVMHSLTCSRMQEELAEAREGFSLAAEQRCTTGWLWQGRGRSTLQSSIWKGAAGLPLA